MADVPLNRTSRIVPIMAARKSNSSDHNTTTITTTARSVPRQRQPRVTRASNKKLAEAESLRLSCLDQLGLYAFPTKGDGNCLYYALSDQLYGGWDRSGEIRTHLAHHMKANREYFVNFTAASGGQRRAPRRAASVAARSFSGTPVSSSASSEEREEAFDAMLARSMEDGTWGGSEDIQAFCQFYKRDVKVYTDSGIQTFRDVNAVTGEERDAVHIAFHNFNHYSSVRNLDGPHEGLPCVTPVATKPDTPLIIDVASPWKISCIQEGLGGRYDHNTIVEMLRQCRGDIDRAFANLLDEDSSTTPSQSSSASASSATSASIVGKGTINFPSGFKPRLPSSRSSSQHSTASKRSANDSDDDEPSQRAGRRPRGRDQKRRILPNVTVGIAFRDEQKNDLVSLRLRVNPDAIVEQANTDTSSGTEGIDKLVHSPVEKRKLRPRKSLTKTHPEDSPGATSSGTDFVETKAIKREEI